MLAWAVILLGSVGCANPKEANLEVLEGVERGEVVKGEDVSELRDIAQYAVEVDALDVAEKLLVMVETDQAFPKDAGLFLLQAKVKQLGKDAKGVKVACDKARALLPKDDKTVCPPK